MKKVFLLVEDHNNLSRCDTVLKKVGFDVEASSSIWTLQEKIMGLNPELVLLWFRPGGKNNPVEFASKVREQAVHKGKLVVVAEGVRFEPRDIMANKIDGILEAPLESEKLVSIVSTLVGLKADLMVEKLRRAQMSAPSSDGTSYGIEKSNSQLSSLPRKDYSKLQFAEKIDPRSTTFSDKAKLKTLWSEVKSTSDSSQMSEINEQKKNFVSALFSKFSRSGKDKK